MVTMEEFDRAQELLGRPGRARPSKHEFAYAGLLRCDLCEGTLVPEVHVKRSGKRYVYYRCRSRVNGVPCPNPCLPETAFEAQLLRDLRRISLPAEGVAWISDHIRPTLEADLARTTQTRAGLETALRDAVREGDTLLTLRLRGQVDEATFERRRLVLLDQEAKLKLQLEQPAASPEEAQSRLRGLLDFSTTMPAAFEKAGIVRRRQILQTVCANPRVRDRKALYKANEPFSFFEGSGLIRRWCAVVERLRTWIIERNFQVPALFSGDDEIVPRKRRAA
jgi:hypothetical protein